MILTVVLLILGLALVVFGSDILVDGASAVARKLGISEFVIGLTIVGPADSRNHRCAQTNCHQF